MRPVCKEYASLESKIRFEVPEVSSGDTVHCSRGARSLARSSIFEEGRGEKEEEGLFDKVGTTDHEMPTVLKVGAEKVKLKKGKGRIHFWRPKWGCLS